MRAAERAADDYRTKPFVPPMLSADEMVRITANLTLVKRKGVYPYEYMTSFERFNETRLPPQNAFFSHLKSKGVSNEDYARHVWDTFAAEKADGEYTMGDYHDLYLLTDVLLLADVMHNFRTLSLDNYKLDPWRFYTVPGLTLSAGLRMTNVTIDLIEDVDQHLFVEAGMRGGVACISKRLAETSDVDEVDENGFRDFLLYLDANNLYGWAMSQCLPTGNYHWLSEEEVNSFDLAAWTADGASGCLLEVDMDCPDELHDLLADYPPAPEKKNISYDMLSDKQRELLGTYMDNAELWKSVPKLVPSLEPKRKYVVHYRALQLYLELGLKLTKIHRVLAFDQSPWLEPYIAFNTVRRAAASSEFLKRLYKLMNNAIFGKTMENVRHRRQIEFASEAKRLKKLAAKPTFRSKMIISEELTAIENYCTSVWLNKPIIVGQAILDLSKVLMIRFHYMWIKTRYPGLRSELLFTDTDSLCYKIR